MTRRLVTGADMRCRLTSNTTTITAFLHVVPAESSKDRIHAKKEF